MHEKFKKYGSVLILGVMVSGLLTILPPVLDGLSAAFKLGGHFYNLHARVSSHEDDIKLNKEEIKQTDLKIREFRSVWCLERLGSPDRLSSEVISACSSWIKNP